MEWEKIFGIGVALGIIFFVYDTWAKYTAMNEKLRKDRRDENIEWSDGKVTLKKKKYDKEEKDVHKSE